MAFYRAQCLRFIALVTFLFSNIKPRSSPGDEQGNPFLWPCLGPHRFRVSSEPVVTPRVYGFIGIYTQVLEGRETLGADL